MTADAARVTRGNLANYDTPWSLAEYTRDGDLWPIERLLLEAFAPPPPAAVLDLGCGAGRTTAALGRLGYRPVGIDLSAPLLAEARRRHPELDLRRMDAARLEFPEESFDAALFSYNGIDCIYPVAERRRCLAEILRVLRPGGALVLSSHNLLGALGSGGLRYARGYWNAARLLAAQLGNPLVREWYVRYEDGGGAQHLYAAPPGHTVRHLRDAGFEVRDVRGATGERHPRRIRLRQQHVYFTARRPA